MDLLNLEISPQKFVNFQVYVFETGKYLRHGKYERDYWWWWGNNKKFFDPAAMHVHFEVAQKKLDAGAIKAKIDEEKKKNEEAKKVADAAKATQDETAKKFAEETKKEGERKAIEQAQGIQPTGLPPGQTTAGGNQQPAATAAPYAGAAPAQQNGIIDLNAGGTAQQPQGAGYGGYTPAQGVDPYSNPTASTGESHHHP